MTGEDSRYHFGVASLQRTGGTYSHPVTPSSFPKQALTSHRILMYCVYIRTAFLYFHQSLRLRRLHSLNKKVVP